MDADIIHPTNMNIIQSATVHRTASHLIILDSATGSLIKHPEIVWLILSNFDRQSQSMTDSQDLKSMTDSQDLTEFL